ncbi:hypothetical protein LJC22_03560 [Desulfosarcina sp. OttesenSCG-928-G10]|nr:hypothetical protein [Desulfosarcina sp. OttesenSCG-928-G10]MDL2322057.1 hypothetical protein [Desulfosarcina sp. OttesenSCG-928-B08]
MKQGHGAKSAGRVIQEKRPIIPCTELNTLWNDDIKWQDAKIECTEPGSDRIAGETSEKWKHDGSMRWLVFSLAVSTEIR